LGGSPRAKVEFQQPPSNVINWKERFNQISAIDPRSLALFRVIVGLLLVVDVATRLGDLTVMYTDDGMFPRAVIRHRITSAWNWSFHMLGGGASFQALLLGIEGLLGLALATGFKTRLAAVGAWLMVISIHHRVPAILSGSEILLSLLLFWGMFLPLGLVWSLDARKSAPGVKGATKAQALVVGIAPAAILTQMALMYLFSAIYKTNADWLQGKAMQGILAHDFYVAPIGAWLAQFPTPLKLLTWATLAVEWVAPLLLLFPTRRSWPRLAALATLAAMHLGIAASMNVGLFSFVSLAGLSLFIPKTFWESNLTRLIPGMGTPQPAGGKPTRDAPPQPCPSHRLPKGICLALLLYVVTLNVDGLPGHPLAPLNPEGWKFLSKGLGLSQRWAMFEGIPSNDGWYVARAKLKDGTEVDLLRDGAPLNWKRPKFPASLYPNRYWQKLFREMTYFDSQGFQVYRAPVSEYLCRAWNAKNSPERQVVQFDLLLCATDESTPSAPSTQNILVGQLIHLDYLPGNPQPKISGYGDADPALTR